MTPDGFLFELSGGALCLDFVNTGETPRAEASRELLASYPDLVAWGLQAGVLANEEGRALERVARARPREAQAALEHARWVRSALFAVFSARAAGDDLPARPFDALSPWIVSALAHQRLVRVDGKRAAFGWADEVALDRVLWAVLRSAADLLTSDGLDRLRQCAGDRCRWLFLDRSKNGSRRWCDMTVCGNRDKVRRLRARRREEE